MMCLTISTATLVACQADDPPTDDTAEETGDGDGDGDGEPLTTTYWQDLAPIYYERCVTCHREGGIAPFVLDDYENAAAWAQASAMAVENRVMPPWLVSDDGTCNSWQHSRALEQSEIDTILAWVDGGMLEGEPRDDLSVPELPGLEGGTPFVTPEFTPAPQGGLFAEFDEYRCFLFDPTRRSSITCSACQSIPRSKSARA
jgi:hypothetical protein